MKAETLRTELDKARSLRDPIPALLYVIGKVLIELLERLSDGR